MGQKQRVYTMPMQTKARKRNARNVCIPQPNGLQQRTSNAIPNKRIKQVDSQQTAMLDKEGIYKGTDGSEYRYYFVKDETGFITQRRFDLIK